jgi:ribonuclease J
MSPKEKDLLIVPIGGLEQVGANCTMIGYGKEWLIIDLGIFFYDKYGIEILMPDISFPKKVAQDIKGILVTHAHEDHIGALPYVLEHFKCPIYTTEFPAEVLKQKFGEYNLEDKADIRIVKPRETLNLGAFDVEFVSLAHSVLGSCGIFIKTTGGKIFHTGDWTVDETPLLGDKIDVQHLENIKNDGVDCLLCDSTNVLNEGELCSELDVRHALQEVFQEFDNKRITVTCFASNLARMETIFHITRQFERKIAIIGRSMHKMIEIITKTKYFSEEFKAGTSSIIDIKEAVNMPPHKVVFLCTGSQGEFRSALCRIARKENSMIKLGEKDIVVFSSRIIPGNELGIRELQNAIIKSGAEIINTHTNKKIHISGHPNKKALEKMYHWLRPKSLIPVHGDAYVLYAHARFAQKNGIKETLVANSGDVISCKDGQLKKIDHHDTWLNCVDGNSIIPLNGNVLKDRIAMACNGHVGVSVVIENNKLLTSPEITVNGIFMESTTLRQVQKSIRRIAANETLIAHNTQKLKDNIARTTKCLIFRHCAKKPTISVYVHEISDKKNA